MPPRSRPEVLFPIFAPVTSLNGIGPRMGKHIERLVGEQIVDEFPNDRMATEVREMLGRLNERAEAENAEAKK